MYYVARIQAEYRRCVTAVYQFLTVNSISLQAQLGFSMNDNDSMQTKRLVDLFITLLFHLNQISLLESIMPTIAVAIFCSLCDVQRRN
jgi:hypothetical protein